MTRQKWIRFGLIAASAVPYSEGFADSIWDRRDPRSGYLWMDNRARRVGDTLTVTINETTGATNTEQRSLKKDTAASGKFDFSGATGNAGSATNKVYSANVTADNSTDRTFQGSANFQTNRQLTDAMQVTVIDVLPNGNLVIEGLRTRNVADENRLMRVSGVVRPNDIDISNTISSQVIANFLIDYVGGGPESRFTAQGWMGRFTNKIWPY
jgi:flagellar L-ring protein precursor FlgH